LAKKSRYCLDQLKQLSDSQAGFRFNDTIRYFKAVTQLSEYKSINNNISQSGS
jgi:hypothetical protein